MQIKSFKYLLTTIIFLLLYVNVSHVTANQDVSNSEQAKLPMQKQALDYCKKHHLSTNFCILINMSIHSGKNRFFVWDFKKKEVLLSCLVSHGCCDKIWSLDYTKDSPKFSNMPNSHCSSLGKYQIGERGWSNWGIHVKYLLHGLDSTNSNALKRTIVLHSWEDVPEYETYPQGTPEGWGCPAIPNKFMKIVDAKLQAEPKPVLLWIYN